MSSITAFFEKIGKDDVALAGGKGASLGEMTGAGIPVPPGFVVMAQAFDEFLKITDLNVELDAILDNVDHEAMHTVDDASEKIAALILGAEMPEEMVKEIEAAYKKLGAECAAQQGEPRHDWRVAVRSSATSEDSADAAWAGQLESYLNVTEDNLIESVKKCWASLFTPRAIFYRFEKYPPDKGGEGGSANKKTGHVDLISVAVVVQKMVESEVSGIAFSVHPVTQDHDQMIIEAGFGLGEAIVQGAITPDSYVIEKSTKGILDINVNTQSKGLFKRRSKSQESPAFAKATADKGIKNGDGDAAVDDPSTGSGLPAANEWRELSEKEGAKQTLTEEEVLELSDLVVKIENHYGFPVDVEWCIEKGKFYIVQSRPITTLG